MRLLELVTIGVLMVHQGASASPKDELPSLEMLDYLGSMVDSEEGLIGPEDLPDGETERSAGSDKGGNGNDEDQSQEVRDGD